MPNPHEHETWSWNLKALERDLRQVVSGEVRFDDGSRALYATDASNYRQVPLGVVLPKSKADIKAAVEVARRYKAPVLPRGGGTSLAGQCCNVAVVIDTSKYLNKIIAIDPKAKTARVEPGLILDDLRKEAEKYHLTFGPDPSTHDHCTLGGMIGNNSCGVHSVMAGKTDENIHELEILTYDGLQMTVGATSNAQLAEIIQAGGRRGQIYAGLKGLAEQYGHLIKERYPEIPRRVSGYNLPYLLNDKGFHVARALVGSEGTCVMVLEAVVRLVDSPPVRSLLVLGYPDVYSAGDHVLDVMAAGPIGLEGLDDNLVEDMKKKHMHPQDIQLLPDGGGWLLAEFGGQNKAESDGQAHRLMEKLKKSQDPPSMKLFDQEWEEKIIWEVRESGLGATARVPDEADTWEGWEDSAVPPQQLGTYLRELRKLFKKYKYGCALYGHFGQACVHTRIDFELNTRQGIDKYRAFIHEAADLVIKLGGSFSGEHGDGQSRAELLPKMFGEELLQGFREFKSIWDPDWKMNPGKIIDAYTPIENLRLGVNYNPQPVKTHFQFAGDDQGSFARATLRCVGVGKCRRVEGGTMCPSFMATREEQHSTRGRARLLFEMLQGEVIGKKVWKDDHVKDALDLCLSCKGCKGECPMNVDMATYKAEFLSHYYSGRLRPRSAYAFGMIYWGARLASHLPGVVNFMTQTPPLSSVAKWMAGMAPQRQIPKFAPETFKHWFFNRRHQPSGGSKVLLWPDTFNNHFHTPVAQAAAEVLEQLGYQVIVPRASLCCGRPLYDYGMLKTAKRLLLRTLRVLQEDIRQGMPVVMLEPSCATVFRDEMLNLLPHNHDAQRLKAQTFLLSEFLVKEGKEHLLPPLAGQALVHYHCHHKAVLGTTAEEKILKAMGMEIQTPDPGCCGMAGSFGFENSHYELSMKVGERILIPQVRQAPAGALIMANGFSCHEQILQATGRRPVHLAQVLAQALAQKNA